MIRKKYGRNKPKNITGQIFGYLSVIKLYNIEKYKHKWLCKCKCGNETVVDYSSLMRSMTRSCGCLRKDAAKARIRNLAGQKYGMLYVESLNDVRKHGVYWNCLCDCGNTCVIKGHSISSGHAKSCGCNNKSGQFKKKEDTPLNGIYYTYKRSAKERGYSFVLTKDEFRIITKKDCYYCGNSPAQIAPSTCGEIYLYNGIDRKDPSIGYEYNNIVPCCGTCNYAKRSMTIEQFKEWIVKVYNNLVIK